MRVIKNVWRKGRCAKIDINMQKYIESIIYRNIYFYLGKWNWRKNVEILIKESSYKMV